MQDQMVKQGRTGPLSKLTRLPKPSRAAPGEPTSRRTVLLPVIDKALLGQSRMEQQKLRKQVADAAEKRRAKAFKMLKEMEFLCKTKLDSLNLDPWHPRYRTVAKEIKQMRHIIDKLRDERTFTRQRVQQIEEVHRKMLYDFYRSLDVDGSGTLDYLEVAELSRLLGSSLSHTEIKEALSEMDADGSGEVDFSEFYIWFTSESSSALKKDLSAEPSIMEIKPHDKNKDVTSYSANQLNYEGMREVADQSRADREELRHKQLELQKRNIRTDHDWREEEEKVHEIMQLFSGVTKQRADNTEHAEGPLQSVQTVRARQEQPGYRSQAAAEDDKDYFKSKSKQPRKEPAKLTRSKTYKSRVVKNSQEGFDAGW